MKFKVGDRVRCINAGVLSPMQDGNNPPIKVGSIYTVNDLQNCPQCGTLRLDVGLISTAVATVCKCGHECYDSTYWLNSSRFVKEVEQVRYVAVPCEVKIDQLVEN